MGEESAVRFSDSHQICQYGKTAGRNGGCVNLLEDLVAIIKTVCLEICWQKLEKGKYLGRFNDCQ